MPTSSQTYWSNLSQVFMGKSPLAYHNNKTWTHDILMLSFLEKFRFITCCFFVFSFRNIAEPCQLSHPEGAKSFIFAWEIQHLMLFTSSHKSAFSWVVIYPPSEEVLLALLTEQAYWQQILSFCVIMLLLHFHLLGLVTFINQLYCGTQLSSCVSLPSWCSPRAGPRTLKGQQSTVPSIQTLQPNAWV